VLGQKKKKFAQRIMTDIWPIVYLEIKGYFAQQVHSQQLQQSHIHEL